MKPSVSQADITQIVKSFNASINECIDSAIADFRARQITDENSLKAVRDAQLTAGFGFVESMLKSMKTKSRVDMLALLATRTLEPQEHHDFAMKLKWRDANPPAEVKALVEALDRFIEYYAVEESQSEESRIMLSYLRAYRAANKQEGEVSEQAPLYTNIDCLKAKK